MRDITLNEWDEYEWFDARTHESTDLVKKLRKLLNDEKR